MHGSSGVRILIDPRDDVRVTAGLLEQHDPTRGRVVVHPTPAPTRDHVFAHDLLVALGRPVNRLDAEHLTGSRPAWAAVTAWMATEDIADLVVLRADRLPARTWIRLLGLCRQTGSRLLLVCHRPEIPAALGAALTGTAHRVLHELPPAPDLHDRIATLSGTEQLSAGLDAAELPPIVTRGVAHYRAEAFRRLSPAAFARVDAVYRHGFDAACAWLRTQVVLRTLAAVDPAGLERVHAFLTGLVHDSSTRRHTLTRLRGAQAGFLAHGVLLTIPNTEDLLTVLSGPGLNSAPVTTQIIDRIRAGVTHPMIAAALAACLFTGLTPRALLYSGLARDADTLRVPFRPRQTRVFTAITRTAPTSTTAAVFHIPPAARPLLRAARHFAQHALPKPGRLPFTPTTMTTEQVTAAATACHITLPDQPADLVATWQIRVTCAPIDAPAAHTQSCTDPVWKTTLDAADHAPNAEPGHPRCTPMLERDEDRSYGRRPLVPDSAAGILQLIADRFSAAPARRRSTRDTARSWLLIRRQLAFYPFDSHGRLTGGLTPHPDVLFALRLIASPEEMTVPERPYARHEDQ